MTFQLGKLLIFLAPLFSYLYNGIVRRISYLYHGIVWVFPLKAFLRVPCTVPALLLAIVNFWNPKTLWRRRERYLSQSNGQCITPIIVSLGSMLTHSFGCTDVCVLPIKLWVVYFFVLPINTIHPSNVYIFLSVLDGELPEKNLLSLSHSACFVGYKICHSISKHLVD